MDSDRPSTLTADHLARSPAQRIHLRGIPSSIAPAFVWFTSLLFTLVMLLGSFILPLLEIPDERHHADISFVASQPAFWISSGWPIANERRIGPEIEIPSRGLRNQERQPDNAPSSRQEQPTFSDLNQRDPQSATNRMAQHPPLYYLIDAAFVESVDAIVPGEFTAVQQIWLFRLPSILLLAPLPIIVYRIALRLKASRLTSYAAAAMPLTIVGLTMRNGPMINNDNLMTLLGALFVLLLLTILQGNYSLRASTTLGVIIGLALFTKGFGVFFGAAAGLMYVYLLWIERSDAWKRILRLGLTAGASMFLAGGWWWIRNVFVYGRFQPRVLSGREPVSGFEPDWAEWMEHVTSLIWGSFWGGDYVFGYSDAPALIWLSLILTAVFLVVALTRSPVRVGTWFSLALIILIAAFLYFTSWRNYPEYGTVKGVQGRYFYAGVGGFVVPMVIGAAIVLRSARRWLPVAIAVLSAVLSWYGVKELASRYWGVAEADFVAEWAAIQAWAVVPGWAVSSLALVVAGSFVVFIVWALKIGRVGEEEGPNSQEVEFLSKDGGRPHSCEAPGFRGSAR